MTKNTTKTGTLTSRGKFKKGKKTSILKTKNVGVYSYDYSDALETAKQVKGWSKYDQTDVSYGVVFSVGLLIGVVMGMILVTPAIRALV